MVFQTLLAMGVNLTSWGWERGQPRDLDARGVAVDGWRLMSGMPTVGALKSIGTSSIRVYKDGRTDLLLPAPDRRLGMAGREAGGGWVGVGTSGDGGAPAAAAADAGGGGAQGGVQVVSVMWEDTRTPWGGSTPIVHRLAIRDALGAVEVRGALPDDSGPLEGSVKEVRPYINGSMPFGGVDLAVLASQAPGSRFGSLYGSFPASGVRVGDVLQGFGCGEQGLAGGTSVTCDPLPPMPDDNWQESGSWDQVRSTLRKLGLGADSVVENARLESVFEGSAEGGKVYHVVRGVMSSWPRASVQLFATFVASRQGRRDWDGRAEDEDRMHFVWKLTALPTSGLTASALIRSVSDIIAPPEMDALYDLRSLSLVLARYALSLHEVPMPSSSSMNVAAGLSIEATLVLNYKTAVGDLLLPMFAAATGAQSDEWREIALAGPVAHDEVRLSGRCPDIALSGRSRLIDPVLHFIVRRFAAGAGEGEAGGVGELEVGFEGTLLLPLSPAESLRLPAYMALVTPGTAAARARQVAAAGGIAEAAAGEDAGGPYLDLAASLPTTIYALFGEADMHLSYVVFRFPFSGATFPHFIAEAVIALGAACSAAQLDTPGACLEGRVVASFDAEDPTENMLAGALPGGGGGGTAGGHDATGIGLTELLEFVGLRADSWQASDVQHLVTSARFPAGATVSYGLREHAFLLPTEPSSPHGPALYRVPPGFGGQGAMHVLGAGGASGSWVADLSSGNMILNAQLPRVSVGGLTLSRDGGIAGGPLLKMVASVLDRKLHAYVQGSLQLGSFESFVLLSVSDMGLSGATSGRFGAGLHVSLKLQAGYLQSHFLSQTTYHISGRVSQGGVHELNQHVPPAVGVLCGRHPQYCTDRRRGGLLGAGWFKICTVTFTDKAVPGGEGSHDLVRATVRAWVHGHMETYTEDLQLNSLEKSVLTLAQAVYSRYMGTYYRHGGVGSCADAADFAPLSLPSDAVTLPEGTIPNALQLQTALLLDNWGSLPEPEHGGAAAKAAWQARRGAVAQRRLAAAKRDWRAYRAAFDYDESLRVAADYTRRPQSYSVREPSALDAAMAPGIPATNSFQGASSGSAAQHGWASSFFAGAFRQGQGDLDAPLRGDYHYDRQRLARLKERLGAIAQHATTRAVRRFRQRAREMRKDMRHDLEVNSHAVRRFARAQERFDQARAKYQRLHTHPRDTGAARADGAGGRSRETMGRGTETAPAHTEQAKYAGSGGGDRVRRRLKRGRAGDVRVEGLQRSLESAESEKRALERSRSSVPLAPSSSLLPETPSSLSPPPPPSLHLSFHPSLLPFSPPYFPSLALLVPRLLFPSVLPLPPARSNEPPLPLP